MTTIWIDAHLSPAIATWITDAFGVTALALRDFGLRDYPIYSAVGSSAYPIHYR